MIESRNLLNHDQFYNITAKNPQLLKEIVENNFGNQKEILDVENEYQHFSFNGAWDLKIELADRIYLVEYKTSIGESNIEEVLRQIKQRMVVNTDVDGFKHLNWYRNQEYTPVLISLDQRFEKFRELFEQNNIQLIVIDLEEYNLLENIFDDEKQVSKNDYSKFDSGILDYG